MRIVLDTNVLVSGIFFNGPPARILEAWRDRRITLVVSRVILDEYEQVAAELARKYQRVNISELLRLVVVTADFVATHDLSEPVCIDPDDDKFGKRAISADTALRLGRFFGTSERFWLNVQTIYDLEIERDRLRTRLTKEVIVFKKAS